MKQIFQASALLFTVLGGPGLPAARAVDKVEVKVVKYPELVKTVKELKGKVIVIDLWADW